MDKQTLQTYQQKYHAELYDHVLPFWMNHSLDLEYGGYFNCLDRDGSVWDHNKHVWLQGRQVWMLAKLYGANSDRPDLLDAAKTGADFLRKFARRKDDGRVHFSLTREGKPLFMQRKIFSECFYSMAMSEYGRAANDADASAEAQSMYDDIWRFAHDLTLVGRPAFEGAPDASALAIPMILLNLMDELEQGGMTINEEHRTWAVQQMQKHIRPELKLVLEHVMNDGTLLDSPEGRIVNPGHAIEAGWFLMDFARKHNRPELIQTSLDMINWSLDFGWDKEHGGIYYFLDAQGYSPVQLEWNMKLWWPHCEALVALLMAWEETGESQYWEWFVKIDEYSFKHFADHEHGEWFGYLDREGRTTHRFKGGPYKGCFHVPRSLYMCEQILSKQLSKL
jgi:N-acylglucosamine 2-epimerase